MAELARVSGEGRPLTAKEISELQGTPMQFLMNILAELQHRRLVRSRRGAVRGYELARPAAAITLADVVSALDGSLVTISGEQPDEIAFTGAAASLRDVWLAVQSSLESLLGSVTLADISAGVLPTGLGISPGGAVGSPSCGGR
jgi:Rrf2 family protein